MNKWLLCVLAAGLAGGVIGCADDQASNMKERQDAAMRDPFGYSPYDKDRTDVSGGGLTDFDKKAMKHDLNSVFSP